MLRRSALFFLLLAPIALATGWAHAQEQGCNAEGPVLKEVLGPDSTSRLPVMASKPDDLTYAALSVTLSPPQDAKGLWELQISVSFDDPKPMGIPYSFESLNSNGSLTAAPTLRCWIGPRLHTSGHIPFPGQRWKQTWQIQGSEGASDSLTQRSRSGVVGTKNDLGNPGCRSATPVGGFNYSINAI